MTWTDGVQEKVETPPSIEGPRGSGRSHALRALWKPETQVVIAWPWQRSFWQQQGIDCNTPDTLARTIMTQWEKLRGKTLIWKADTREEQALDEENYAKKLLERGEMTAGAAHWFLNRELDTFRKKGLLPVNGPSLLCDDLDEWEPEAKSWITRLKFERIYETKRGPGPGVYRPGGTKVPMREIRGQQTEKRAGEWSLETLWKLRSLGRQSLCVVVQREKTKWKEYIQRRGPTGIEIRHAAELEGRVWNTLIIPSLENNWGGASRAKDWLDLAASRAQRECLIRITPEVTWLPKKKESTEILRWRPN